ncbi:MAG: transporter substrate-binding domain-containing protein [Cellulomonadaceae bacterium]|jgi:ABC-type amino acid transport substrate-binding protein|nr:transporter substrate-binding domain-containing protein [Cellulomonadaceae bacterium]
MRSAKKLVAAIAVPLILLSTGCSSAPASNTPQLNATDAEATNTVDEVEAPQITNDSDYAAFAGTTLGVIQGALCINAIDSMGATPEAFATTQDAVDAVESATTTGFVAALSGVRAMVEQRGDDVWRAVEIPESVFSVPIGAFGHDQAVIDAFNEFFASREADGTIAAMQARWMGEKLDLVSPIADLPEVAEDADTLVVAVTEDAIPYSFRTEDGEWMGYGVELAERFAASQGMQVEFKDLLYADLVDFVGNGNADLGVGSIGITPERQEIVLFSNPITDEAAGILVPLQK